MIFFYILILSSLSETRLENAMLLVFDCIIFFAVSILDLCLGLISKRLYLGSLVIVCC
jgi:hypothetical protein